MGNEQLTGEFQGYGANCSTWNNWLSEELLLKCTVGSTVEDGGGYGRRACFYGDWIERLFHVEQSNSCQPEEWSNFPDGCV